jgi:Holliday junction resolvase RusA-like endonuclease
MSDELIEEIDKANLGESPSPFGRATFLVLGTPVSVQSNKKTRDTYIQSIKSQFNALKYILTGEIILDVTWLIPIKSRFETDAKADIDNCIKPIIDAFSGPDGLFIDDCQLRGLYICWRHIESQDERVAFEFKFHPDEFSLKNELAFVRLKNALCTPVNLDWPIAARHLWARMLKSNQASKNMLEELGITYPAVAGFLGSSRPFHVTRINGFKILSLSEFININSIEVLK